MTSVADRSSSSASLEAWMKLRAIEGVGDHIVLALVCLVSTAVAIIYTVISALPYVR